MISRKFKRKLIKDLGKGLKGTVKTLGKLHKLIPSEKAKTTLKSAAVFASFGALMYFKNRILPFYGDDYPYAYVWDGEHNGNLAYGDQQYERVWDLKSLVRSQLSHYKTWDGRTIAESLVQIFMALRDKTYFDRANTIALLLQLWLCASIAKGRPVGLGSISPKEALLLTAGFYACAPHLEATCFWLTGSMNYLWMGILQSIFVLPYSMHFHGRKVPLPGPLAFLSGLLSGWSTETGAGASLLLASMETLRALKTKSYESFMGWGLAGGVIGLLLLLLAPGNRKKLEIEYEHSGTIPKTPEEALPGYVPSEYLYTPLMFKKWFKEGFLTTLLRELPLQLPVLAYFLKEVRNPKTDLFIMGLETAVFAVPSVMMLSPEYPRRATYPSIIYLMAAALCAAKQLNIPPFSLWSPLAKSLGITAAAAYVLHLLASLIMDADVSDQMDRQLRYIHYNMDKPLARVKGVMGSPFYERLAGDSSFTWDITMGIGFDRADDPYNKAAATYYGAKGIVSEDIDEHVYEETDLTSRLFSITNPIRSLFSKIAEVVLGVEKDSSRDRRDTIGYRIKRYGSDYGGHFIYEKPLKNSEAPIVYSFGTGEDLTFSMAILKETKAEIFAYDPNPDAIAYLKKLPIYKDPRFHFTAAGLSDRDGETLYYKPKMVIDYSGSIYNYTPDLYDDGFPIKIYCLKTLFEMNGHKHIDLLKLDIEGAEFAVVNTLNDLDVRIDQICLESHERFFSDFEDKIAVLIHEMHDLGYIIIYSDRVENNYTFLKMD